MSSSYSNGTSSVVETRVVVSDLIGALVVDCSSDPEAGAFDSSTVGSDDESSSLGRISFPSSYSGSLYGEIVVVSVTGLTDVGITGDSVTGLTDVGIVGESVTGLIDVGITGILPLDWVELGMIVALLSMISLSSAGDSWVTAIMVDIGSCVEIIGVADETIMGDSDEDSSSFSESSVTICIIDFSVLLSGFDIKASSVVFIEGSGVTAGSFVSCFLESSSNISLSSNIFDIWVVTVAILFVYYFARPV